MLWRYDTRSISKKLKRKKSNEPIEYFSCPPLSPPTKKVKTQSPETIIKNFADYYDDSSDEEEDPYNIDQSWKRYREKMPVSTHKPSTNTDLFSFVAHAAGISLLRFAPVKKIYYQLKKKVLHDAENDRAIIQLMQLVQNACLKSASKALEALKRFLLITNQKKLTPEQINIICTTVVSEYDKIVNKFTLDNLHLFIEWMTSAKYDLQQKPEAIAALEDELAIQLANQFAKHVPFGKSKHDRAKARKDMLELIRQTILDICQALHLDTKYNKSGKDQSISLLSKYDSSYKNMIQKMIALLDKCDSRGNVQSMVLKQVDEKQNKEELLQAYILDLSQIKQSEPDKSLSTKDEDTLDNYFSADIDSIRDELSGNFTLSLQSDLVAALETFQRPTLGSTYQFSSTNAYQFYANINLSNRSQNRETLNLKDLPLLSEHCTNRTWSLFLSPFNDIDVVENQEILSSAGRKDFVYNIGNYEKVYQTIEWIKDYFQQHEAAKTDADIALWIREILHGHAPDFFPEDSQLFEIPDKIAALILRKLHGMTYLLLGCEPVRNSSISVINQMILDLIIANKGWTFEEAMTGKLNDVSKGKDAKLMPMAPEGAVAVARAVESDYRNYMPYQYCYRGVEDNDMKHDKMTKDDLKMFEARAFHDWLVLKNITIAQLTHDNAAGYLLNSVMEQFTPWLEPGPENSIQIGQKVWKF